MPWQFFQYLRALMKHAWAILAAIGGSALLALPSLVRPALSPIWQRRLDSLLTSSPTEIRHAYLVLLPVGLFWATYRAWKEENDARIKAEKESPADLRAELASVRTELEGLRRHQQRSITRQEWDEIEKAYRLSPQQRPKLAIKTPFNDSEAEKYAQDFEGLFYCGRSRDAKIDADMKGLIVRVHNRSAPSTQARFFSQTLKAAGIANEIKELELQFPINPNLDCELVIGGND
ncbi:MAG: hypothetical protein WA206_13050 [Candidatus Binatus sp.]